MKLNVIEAINCPVNSWIWIHELVKRNSFANKDKSDPDAMNTYACDYIHVQAAETFIIILCLQLYAIHRLPMAIKSGTFYTETLGSGPCIHPLPFEVQGKAIVQQFMYLHHQLLDWLYCFYSQRIRFEVLCVQKDKMMMAMQTYMANLPEWIQTPGRSFNHVQRHISHESPRPWKVIILHIIYHASIVYLSQPFIQYHFFDNEGRTKVHLGILAKTLMHKNEYLEAKNAAIAIARILELLLSNAETAKELSPFLIDVIYQVCLFFFRIATDFR